MLIVNLNAIAFGDGKFVAVGDHGTIIRFSSDTGWTVQNSETTNKLTGVAFGDGQFIAVSDRGQIVTSADAVNWTAYTVDASLIFRAITFGNGLFVAVSFGTNTNRFLTSSDGIMWTSRPYYSTQPPEFVYLRCVAYGAGVFVAGGSPNFYSTNGLEWHEAQMTNMFFASFSQALSYGNGLFVGHDRYSGAV